MQIYCLFIALAVGATSVLADITAPDETAPVENDSQDALDNSHKYIVRHADNIAEWLDGFFGDTRTEQEAPYSTVRLRLEGDWDENDDFETDVKLRGKVHLPKLSKRLSLIFSDNGDDQNRESDLATSKQDDTDNVSLQYTARDEERSRVDFRVGIRSSGNPKTSVRYRYKYPFSESVTGRFSEELRYRGGDGFDAITRLNLDKVLSNNKVLRWDNKIKWEEEESGTSWSTSVSLDKRLDQERAISYYVAANGETQPDGLTNSYGLGVRYRQSFHKPWLFFEVQPHYQWRKPDDMTSRDGVAGVLFRIEAVFEREAKEF